ncbi:MAG: electron transfer flavoprotein subunit alpha/FixB family protein [Desulfurococcales archaeon]|nr:electron transfer flavoprotein subunit alpha/FixB family protein [Desulfurococcales archaeon]
MVSSLVVGGTLGEILESLTAASLVGEPIVLAYGQAAAKAEEIASRGVKVFRLNGEHPDLIFKAAKKLFEELKPKVIIGHSTKNNRDALSRLAGLYDLAMATDVVKIEPGDDHIIYERGFLSERAIAREKASYPAIVLINQKVFEPYSAQGQGEIVDIDVGTPDVQIVEIKKKQLSGINLEEAEIIVGVGRGFKKKEDLKLAFELAELLGAQVGASRPIAADYKWLPEDAWIGISGKRVAPKLYIAIGISGAPQHMAGVNNSKIIVAINKDKSAPIFKQADYGVVADLYQFVPVLIKKLKERKEK